VGSRRNPAKANSTSLQLKHPSSRRQTEPVARTTATTKRASSRQLRALERNLLGRRLRQAKSKAQVSAEEIAKAPPVCSTHSVKDGRNVLKGSDIVVRGCILRSLFHKPDKAAQRFGEKLGNWIDGHAGRLDLRSPVPPRLGTTVLRSKRPCQRQDSTFLRRFGRAD
jgi:hypothetical protein